MLLDHLIEVEIYNPDGYLVMKRKMIRNGIKPRFSDVFNINLLVKGFYMVVWKNGNTLSREKLLIF